MRLMLTITALAASASAFGAGDDMAKDTAEPGAYQSVLTDYRAYQEVEVASWREVNDAMERLGGHVGHMNGNGGHGMRPSPDTSAPMQGGHGKLRSGRCPTP